MSISFSGKKSVQVQYEPPSVDIDFPPINITVKCRRLSLLKSGNLTADGTEQVVIDALGSLVLQGYVDLDKMVIGDIVTLRQYAKVEEGGDYKLYDTETYSGVQDKPLIHFRRLCGYFGIQVTLRQVAGLYKKFGYLFMKEE